MKKVLVIDVEKCGDCAMCQDYVSEEYYGHFYEYCVLNNNMLVEANKLSPNCPLKDLPSKLETPNYAHESYYHYNKGWNDLLDEIENQK